MDIKKRMSICSEEVSSISEKLSHRGVCGDVSEIDERRPPSPVPSKQLELIVRKNVVAAAQSHEGKRSKRVTSKTVSQTTSEEASGYSSQYICLPCGLPPARSDSPDVLDISSKPKEIKSLLPPAAAVRPMTPTQRVVFPPNIPEALVTRSRSPSPLPGRKKVESKVKGTPPFFVGLPVVTPNPEPVLECKVEQLEPPTQQCPVVLITQDSVEDQNLCQELEDSAQTTETVEIDQTDTETTQTEEIVGSVDRLTVEKVKVQTDNPIEDKYYSKTEVEQIVKEELQKVFLNLKEPPKEEKPPELSLDDLPKPIIASGDMAMALSTASDRPFTPMPFPKVPSLSLRPDVPEEPPKKKTVAEKYMPCPEPSEPYFPPAPPPPESEKKDDRTARALREVGCRSPMTEALTVASTRSYSPLPSLTKVSVSQSTIKDVRVKSSQQTATVTSCPIKQVKPPLMIEKSAFTSTGNGSLVPKSTPLVYIPHLQRNQTDSQSSERHGIPRDEIAHQGKTKQVVAGLETTTSETLTINGEQLQAMKCKDVQYSCAVARNPPPQPEGACAQKVPTSGLRSEHLLPYYQQYIGDIPVRNRVLSPIPHPIKAPSMAPVPMPTPPNLLSHPRVPVYHTSKPVCAEPQKESFASKQICCMSGRTTSNQQSKDLGMMSNYQSKQSSSGTMMSAQQSKEATISSKMAAMQVSSCQESRAMQQSSESSLQSTKTISQTSASSSKTCKMTSRTSRMSSPLAGKSSTLTSSGKQTFKPDIPARSLSPSWKADYVRSVQNLSPITVRLPSPQPPPLKPKGELTQTTSANVHVKNTKPKTSSSRSKPPTSTTQSSKGAVGSCGTSKGCGTPPGSPTGRRSPGELKVGPCGTSRGCGTPPGSPKSRLSPVDIKVGPCGTSKGCNTPPGSPTGGETTGKQLNSGACQAYSNKSCMKQNTQFSSSVNKENLLTYKKSSVATQDTSLYKTGSLLTNYQNTAHNGKIQTRSNKSVSVSEVDASHSHFNVNHHRTPLQPIPSSPNTLWPSFPANLPLPRNCGVNPSSSGPNAGGAGGLGGGRSSIAGSSAPRRGRGVLNAAVPIGGRVPLCGHCNSQIRGPFITALGKIWCPEHFVCVNPKCKRPLQDIGFVEEDDGLYCEFCFEQYLAPPCDKCHAKIKGDCLNAIGKHFHPECFKCSYCEKLFGNNPFFLEDGLPYCENDWNELFTTKCFSCGFPIEAGDRWVEALNNNYHSQCFNCTMCKKNLDGQSFFAKGGRPFCKNHAR